MPSKSMTTQETPKNDKIEGWVLNIERYTLHDGPGIRTTVFLKGCPLRCLWCSNPESQMGSPEIVYFEDKCIGCGRCVGVCPQDAIVQEKPGEPVTVLFDRCDGCGKCIDSCYVEALTLAGEKMTAEEVVSIIERDWPFYKHSQGGVTLSGGEALAQPAFSAEVLRLCQAKGIHTAIQTSGQAPLKNLQQVLPYLDLVIFDIKHMDNKTHQKLTGVPNGQILDNLSYINSSGTPIVIQVPLIPGLNDSEENLDNLAKLVKSLPSVMGLSLLSYHTLGTTKYRCTGREYALIDLPKASPDYLEEKKAYFVAKGVPLVAFNG
ncbi:glycyl-radical enzyme activating protein (plasmid) [Chloroflexota bacterium]|nr:glycyl-radical enzyme activating protein [Chloroflexota bacterium]